MARTRFLFERLRTGGGAPYHHGSAIARNLTLRSARENERIPVGTAMICGNGAAESVHKDSYPATHAEHLVAYTASKAAAEQMLRDKFSDLPLVVETRAEPLPWGDYTVIKSEDVRLHKKRMVEAFGPTHGRRMLMAQGLYLRFCELNVRFDNSRLRAEGVRAAPTLLDYLDDDCLAQSHELSIVEQADDEI